MAAVNDHFRLVAAGRCSFFKDPVRWPSSLWTFKEVLIHFKLISILSF
jgi:hypothetical protein